MVADVLGSDCVLIGLFQQVCGRDGGLDLADLLEKHHVSLDLSSEFLFALVIVEGDVGFDGVLTQFDGAEAVGPFVGHRHVLQDVVGGPGRTQRLTALFDGRYVLQVSELGPLGCF